jgi:hypothetical protein
MNKVIRRSRFSTHLITAALLTVFVSGFGVFANIQIEQRSADCIIPVSEALDSENCTIEKYLANIAPMEQMETCQYAAVNANVMTTSER